MGNKISNPNDSRIIKYGGFSKEEIEYYKNVF